MSNTKYIITHLLVLLATAQLVKSDVTQIHNDVFYCEENRTIETAYACDGDIDCSDGVDEAPGNCSSHSNQTTTEENVWLEAFLEGAYTSTEPCGRPDTLPKFQHHRVKRIVNGELSQPNSWPWQVALYEVKEGVVFCGATLIHPQWVLTAAHCIESLSAEVIEALFGRFDVTIEERHTDRQRVAEIFKHVNHRYPDHKSNDIALLKLKGRVKVTSHVKLACLPFGNPRKESCFMSGWGRVSEKDEPQVFPKQLLQTRLQVIEHEDCTKPPFWGPRISRKQLCAGGDGLHDMCWGDSGGGLMCEDDGLYTVHGISSFTGHKCAILYRPAVFTRIARYMSWIEAIIKSDVEKMSVHS